MTPLFLGRIGLTELLVLLLIVVLCFGGKKIPELMRGVGRGMKAFREGLEGSPDEPKSSEEPKPADGTRSSDTPDASAAPKPAGSPDASARSDTKAGDRS